MTFSSPGSSSSTSRSITFRREGSFAIDMEDERDDEAVDSSTDTPRVDSAPFPGSMISGTTTALEVVVSLLAFEDARFLVFFGLILTTFVNSFTGSFPLFLRSLDLEFLDDLLAPPTSPPAS